jgi:hypothetical protein
LYHDRAIFTGQPEAIKKTAKLWRVSGGLSALAPERHKQQIRRQK